ncbi:Protein-arginine deiminase [Akanthomyces lecanii RCEF 1005]|uniref:Protein-arginine deiminase n=1 Tax=Akanthomyces lecanii RCEF 1005 TaxID=1081108 RepID=A0A168GK11_CORDF|nr:Protein-arginine deiminase [Akanthomyces lecanii RCEF 1005]
MLSLGRAAALTLGFFGASQALEATILADTNRDGKVDAAGKSDLAGKNRWTETSGALFLANIGDSNGRCAANITTDILADDYVDYSLCHDATDNVQRNPKYLAPVLTLPISNLSALATGSVVVVDKTAASKVRIFLKDGANWAYVPSNYTFTAEQLRQGLNLGIDARDVRTPEWDGRATVQFSVKDGSAEAKDSVAMRVAPVLTHHHAQLAEQVFATDGWVPEEVGNRTNQFAEDLERLSAQAGLKQPFYAVNVTDNWTQDFFEPGYTTMPGPDGPVVLRVMIASAQKDSERNRSHRWLFRELRSDTVGAVLHRTFGGTTDSTGNLETVPPYTFNGKSYPAGRAIMGSHSGVKPEMVKFLDAQEVQAPIEIDTTWLEVGHTDEFMQFLPAKSERGWVMMVDDPLAGLAILQQAQKNGNGEVRALSRERQPYDWDDTCLPKDTINDVLNRANFTEIQKYCDDNIKANIAILKRETGITDTEIIRVPTLYHPHKNTLGCSTFNGTYWTPPPKNSSVEERDERPNGHNMRYRKAHPLNILEAAGVKRPSGIAKRDEGDALQVSAFYPGCINGVVLSNTDYVAPNPWGPIIDGKDILATAVTAAYAKVNYTIHYMDDWFSHHTGSGEVHCGSNTVRDITAQWW